MSAAMSIVSKSIVSKRVHAADAAFAPVRDFYMSSRYAKERFDPEVCDFTFGNQGQVLTSIAPGSGGDQHDHGGPPARI